VPKTLTAALTLAVLLIAAGPAAARDRNHDGLPDKWEKSHHLSLKVKQAKRDQDRDGMRNKAEFKAGFNPRDDDSDNDGVEDGNENAGTIESFDATTGKLTIKLFGGDSISGLVDGSTEIKCDDDNATASSSGDDDQGDDHGDDNEADDNQGDDHGDDNQGDDNQGDDAKGDDDQGDGDSDPDHGADSSCGTEALTVGREVEEADVHLSNGKATFDEVQLG
jgi:hypothetical protein